MTTFVSNKPVQQIGFASTTQHDWLKKLASLFHPIRSRTKTNFNSLTLLFPRLASATSHCFLWLTVCVLCGWPVITLVLVSTTLN